MRVGKLRAVIVLAVAALPAQASAATVSTRDIDQGNGPEQLTVFQAAPGEVNRLLAQDLGADWLQTTIADAGAPLTVLPDCLAGDRATTSCCSKASAATSSSTAATATTC